MSKRPTLQDLAREAGVGIATVDRVLHGRPNVSARAVERVTAAAERIGYHAGGLIAARHNPAPPHVRLGFVLHKEAQPFYRALAAALEAASEARSDARVIARIVHAPSQSPEDFANAFRSAAEDADAVAGSAVNHAIVDTAVRRLIEAGLPVFALLNDFAQSARTGYIGLDNMRVGRIAGWTLANVIRQPGKVAVFVGGNRWHGHILRETGFRACLRDRASALQVLDTKVNLETRQVTYEATLDLLDRVPDLRGLYIAGGGMEGAIAALRETRPPGRVALAVNELTPDSRAALTDGYAVLAIATPLEALAWNLVATMLRTAAGSPPATDRHILEPQLYVPESV